MSWNPYAVIVLVACGVAALSYLAALMHRRSLAREERKEQEHFADQGPSPLDLEEVRTVIAQAEKAAAQHVLGTPATNPYPKHTRLFVLWETQFQRMLMEYTHEHKPKRRPSR